MSEPPGFSEPTDAPRRRAPVSMPDPKAIAVAAAVAAGLLVALIISRWTLLVVLTAACVAAAGELLRLARRLGATPVPLAGFAAVAGALALAASGPDALLDGLPSVAGGAAALSLIVLVAQGRIEGALAGAASTVGAALSIAALGSFAVVLRQLPDGFRVSLAFAALVAANELASRAAGVALGGPSLAPSIGPEPTWSGVAAGTAAATLSAVIVGAALSPPLEMSRALVLAAVVSIAVPLGRVCVALLRQGEPARGVLARIDGALFSAPLFYFAYRAMTR